AALAVLAVPALCGCGTTPHVTAATAIALTPPAPATLMARFPGAAGLLGTIEAADSTGRWRTGDRVLLGLSFARGSSRTDRMLLVELRDRPGRRPRFERTVAVFGDEVRIDSPTRATLLTLYDADGRLISDQKGQLAEIFLDYGPIEVARVGGGYAIATGAPDRPRENPHGDVTLDALRPGVYGMMSLLAFGEGASDNPTLAALIEQAFTLGQKLKLLFSWGRFEIRFGAVEPLDPHALPVPGFAPREGFDCEVRISIGENEALSGRAVVVPPDAPLGLCGGIVAAELTNSADPGLSASLVLLGASRGAADTNEGSTNHKAVN
ncbi:MAG: hypothetical protein K8E66_13760, partial [Phycisphaerales bacterium]|nr:hypothetical protein [Phycisphaerales bacterium]